MVVNFIPNIIGDKYRQHNHDIFVVCSCLSILNVKILTITDNLELYVVVFFTLKLGYYDIHSHHY